jgi:sugar lactone lactonase YvrE
MKFRPHISQVPPAVPLLLLALSLLFSASQSVHAQRMPQDSWYLAKEMKRFVEPGKFYHPHDAALGPDGNLYVADRYNHRVQVFDQDGNFIRQFGNYGSGNGEFNELTGIHVTPDGKVYVSEWGNNRVQVFDAQGKFIRSMGQAGSGEGQLSGPHGVTVDNDGNVYVVEHNNARVSVFKPDGTYLRQWGSSGSADGQFQGVIAICRTPDNKIAVLERDGERRIQIFDTTGKFLNKFSGNWVSQGWWESGIAPHGIESDSAGNFYVTGREWRGVHVFDSTGSPIRVFGENGGGSGNGQFNPFGLAVGNGKVFACDWDNHRIAVFSTAGTWIKNFGTHQNGDVDTHGIAVDANGNIYISYHQSNVICKFSPELSFIKSFGSAGSGDGQFNGVLEMAIGPNERLYVVDHSGHRVQYFDLNGNFLGKFGGEGTTNGKFKFPWGIAIGKDNKVYVADRDNHRIQIFDANGNYLSKFGTQGSFDGQFQSPYGLAIAPNGDLLVADCNNLRIQKFDSSTKFLAKVSPPWTQYSYAVNEWYGPKTERIHISSDGVLFVSGKAWHSEPYEIAVFSPQFELIKRWQTPFCPMAETKSGDLIAAHGDRVVRVWKRAFRTVHPEPANALPLPTIVAQKRRPGTALVDVDDNVTVQTAALAFKNGGNSLADVIPITSFAEGTGNKLGANIATGQTHRFTWDVAQDWPTDFGEVQLEILAKDGRGLLNLDFLQIPATGNQTALKISRSPLTDNDFLSVWYWLLATGDARLKLDNGRISLADESNFTVSGLTATYFQDWNYTGTNQFRVDAVPKSPNSSSSSTISGITFLARSIRWAGDFVPSKSGNYTFTITRSGNFAATINGTQYISTSITFSAQAGQPIPVTFQISTTSNTSTSRNLSITVTPPEEASRSLSGSDFQTSTSVLADTVTTSEAGRRFIFTEMDLREATVDEVLRAKEAGTPGVINQWEPKLKVGPDERPAKINAYGFDTGGSGYWVVPVSENN